jgi:lipopolysaccharide export system permease protein
MLIDRYIARAQLHAFVIVFVSLAGLTFVVDAFTNMEEFVTHAAEGGGLWKVLGKYYGYRLISFFDATSAIISLASAMFALSWLERHNELTALLAAGVTRWRIARGSIAFAAIVAILAGANRELVLPRIREAFSRNAQDLKGNKEQPFEARYDHETEILAWRDRCNEMFSAAVRHSAPPEGSHIERTSRSPCLWQGVFLIQTTDVDDSARAGQ